MNPEATYYSAMQIARALGCTRQAVFQKLEGTAPDGILIKDGRQVKAWSFGLLPADLRTMLIEEAKKRHYRGPHALLGMPPKVWNPPVPLAETSDQYIQKAMKIQQALRPILARLNDSEGGALKQQGIQEYQKVLGYEISPRHWRRLLKRTIARDDGAENWDRLELYIDENVGRKPLARPMQEFCQDEALQSVTSAVSAFADPKNPTHQERALIWSEAFEYLEDALASGKKKGPVQKALVLHLLSKAPFLAKNESALRRTLFRKFKAWSTGNRSIGDLLDKRPENSGFHRAPKISEDDRLRLIAQASICGGRVSQAYREVRANDDLSPEILTHYPHGQPGQKKSYVPRKIRDAVKHDVKIVMPYVHGPHIAKVQGAYIDRDWSNVPSGDWQQGDDTTLPVYWWSEEHPQNPTRGQFLAMIDLRSTFILAFVLIDSKSYNARHIRNLISKSHDGYGLPRKGYYFEHGSWESATVVGRGKGEEIPWSKTKIGLGGPPFNFQFRHAREAQAKTIERVFGALQNLMEREWGYCGRNERDDKYERVQKQLQCVRSGRVHPSECFLHQDEWFRRLEGICDQYNHERQDGERLQGRSPWEAYNEFFTEPLRKMNALNRYLLADCKYNVTVGRNGITLPIGKDRFGHPFTYKNETTGRLLGRDLIAWFSPEEPEILTVTDLEEEIPFTVERAAVIPAMDATEEEMEMAQEQNSAHNAYGKCLYRIIRNDFPSDFQARMFTPAVSDPAREALGVHMQQQREAVRKKRRVVEAEENQSSRELIDLLNQNDPEEVHHLQEAK